MSTSNDGKVASLADARLQKSSKSDMWEASARVSADLVLSRLSSMYGGPVTLQALERKSHLQFTARYSAQWNDKLVHRSVTINLDDAGNFVNMEALNGPEDW